MLQLEMQESLLAEVTSHRDCVIEQHAGTHLLTDSLLLCYSLARNSHSLFIWTAPLSNVMKPYFTSYLAFCSHRLPELL